VSETEPPEPPDTPQAAGSSGAAEPTEFSEFFRTADLPQPRLRPRSHRGGFDSNQFLPRLMAPVMAVAVVIVVIVLLIWINGSSPGSKQSPAAVGPGTPPAHSPVVVAPTSRPGTPTSSLVSPTPTQPPLSPSDRPQPQPSVTIPPGASTHSSRPKPSIPTAMAPVQVLNNSRRTGLAHEVAAAVQAKGWRISAVGNLQGLVAESTVYFAPGERAAARHLEHDFVSIRRIEPNSAGHIRGTGLTLVVTADWAL
jgi:hypothetical protein